MTAAGYVLIKVSSKKARDVYHELKNKDYVQSLDAVLGPFDIIAIIQAEDYSNIGQIVMDDIRHIEGVTDTVTCNVVNFEV